MRINAARLLSRLSFATLWIGHATVSALDSPMAWVQDLAGNYASHQMPEKKALDGIEQNLLSMARSRKAGTEPEGLAGVISSILGLLENSFRANIRARYNATQTALDQAWNNFTCGDPNESLASSNFSALRTAHTNCRVQQQALYDEFASFCHIETGTPLACTIYQGLQNIANPDEFCTMDAGSKKDQVLGETAPTIGNYLRKMKNRFATLKQELLQAKWACGNASTCLADTHCNHSHECSTLNCSYWEKGLTCDEKQAEFEEVACRLRLESSCSTYDACYAQRLATYQARRSEAQAVQPGFNAEWEAVHRIECYLEALNGTRDSLEASITVCKNQTYSVAEVTLKLYGQAPAKKACVDHNDLQPGSPHFASRWYAGLPQNAAALTCASRCCSSQW
eukprot:TRINITY_DN6264_c0_g1_i12.p1 TRINITY_DN6264_c0_g1~~TRINITY_DN6264_c0_g1_i12.p1  ORF type:complete len:396 (-),score=55.93 TRINITY_DN6264_c0_g1_i12:752-1939(-)